jgi:hypothetical protein
MAVDDVEEMDNMEHTSPKDNGSSLRNSTADLMVTNAKLIKQAKIIERY